MGLLNYRPELLIGGYPNSNAEETDYLEKATPVKEGDVIAVTEPCAYTLIVKDSWGNTGLYGIEIKDVNHEYVREDHWDSRYHITEPY